jgi:hypothetical protein
MVCKEIKSDVFEAALSGAAPGDKVREHMAACAGCKNEFESMRSTMNVLDTWTAPEPSPYFDVRFRARLREAKEQEQHGRATSWLEKIGIRQLTWKPIAALSFAVIMAIGGGVYIGGGGLAGHHVTQTQANLECPVTDLQALDKNQQLLNELQDLDDTNSTDGSAATQPVSE